MCRLPGGLAFDRTGPGDAYRLLGVGEAQSARGGHGDGLDRAGLPPAVAGVAAAVADRYLRPGKGLELGEQGRLVAFDRDQQVPAAGGDLLGVVSLRVERIRDE